MEPMGRTSGSIVLQPRDIALLRGLFECRVMTAEHACALYFDGRGPAAKKRLYFLKSEGFIGERPRRPFEPAMLCVRKQGIAALQTEGILSEYPAFAVQALERRAQVSPFTLRHELEVMDMKVAFHAALKGNERLSLAEFNTWPLLNQFEAFDPTGRQTLVKPDGFVRIHEREGDVGMSEHSFFIEVDRSTETQDVLVSRINCYLDYYKRGGFAARNGASRFAFKDYPFRVLVVFKSAERRNNIAERLIHNVPPILTLAHLATRAEATNAPFGASWITPSAYRDALLGVSRVSAEDVYIRQRARDIQVEAAIVKRPLFT